MSPHTSMEGCTDHYRLDTDCHKVSGDLGPLSDWAPPGAQPRL